MTSLDISCLDMPPALAQASAGGVVDGHVMDYKGLFADAIIPILGDLCVRYDLDQEEMDQIIEMCGEYYWPITDEFRRTHGLCATFGRPGDAARIGLWR